MAEERGRPERAVIPDADTDVVLDAASLRALAHPVRVRLVGLLRAHGPSTATRLAERTGLTSGVTSYHLRQLGAAGLVEEDTERGNARDRWWRSVHRMSWMDITELTEREPEAAMTYLRSVAAAQALRVEHALNALPGLPRPWLDVVDLSEWPLRLTPEEAASLREELRAVIARYRRETPEGAAGAPEEAERLSLVTQLLPEPGRRATGAPGEDPAGGSA